MLSTTVKTDVLYMCDIELIHSSAFRQRDMNCSMLALSHYLHGRDGCHTSRVVIATGLITGNLGAGQ